MKMFSKPKVLVCVLTGNERHNWPNPYLAQNLISMSQDTRFTVNIEMVIDKHPVDSARNYCVVMARSCKAEFLLMIDNDQCFELSPLDVLSKGLNKDVIGFPTMQGFSISEMQANRDPIFPNFSTLAQPERDGEFFTVEKVGTGSMLISRRVWEKIPGPWFKWCYNETGELHETDGAITEDFYACGLFQRHGFKIWIHDRVIPHWKTCEVGNLGMALQTLKQMAAQTGRPMPAGKVQWGKR
jgi:hypothetical protein